MQDLRYIAFFHVHTFYPLDGFECFIYSRFQIMFNHPLFRVAVYADQVGGIRQTLTIIFSVMEIQIIRHIFIA